MVIPETLNKNGFILEGYLTSCTFNYLNRDVYSRASMLFLFIGGFLMPLIIIVLFYTLMWSIVKKNEMFTRYSIRKKNISQVELSMYYLSKNATNMNMTAVSTGQNFNGRYNEERYKLIKNKIDVNSNVIHRKSTTINLFNNTSSLNSFIKREIRVARMIILIVIMFCIAWAPYAIVALFGQFGTNINNYLTPLSTSLPSLFAKTSSIYNPILYTLINKECRKFYKKVFFNKVPMLCKKQNQKSSLKQKIADPYFL
jgi:hypothetical protein